MITLDKIIKTYGCGIKRQFRIDINKYINNDNIQDILKKALKYQLTEKEIDYIFKVGRHNSKTYPHLYYLCTIYIHPITKLQYIANGLSKYPITGY